MGLNEGKLTEERPLVGVERVKETFLVPGEISRSFFVRMQEWGGLALYPLRTCYGRR